MPLHNRTCPCVTAPFLLSSGSWLCCWVSGPLSLTSWRRGPPCAQADTWLSCAMATLREAPATPLVSGLRIVRRSAI
jgi:hypothetical protein